MTSLNRRRLLASSLLTSACLFAAPAAAQVAQPQEASPEVQSEEAKPAQDVVVTGSRIQRPDLTTASPVNVIGQQEIQLRQPSTTEELLRDLPSVRPNLGPAVDNGGSGAATVDLRGLGANRTLVLLDGHRVVPYSLAGLTDLDSIPVALVDRVDVVTGGASSVYGADAVAGVVNFVTKRDFTGIDATTNYRISDRGDAKIFRGDLTIGGNFADGKGNAVLSLGYTKRDFLAATDRPVGAIALSSANGLFAGSSTTTPVLITTPSQRALGIGTGSGGAIIDPATGAFRVATQADGYNSNIGTSFQAPLERYSIYGSAHYEVTPGVELYSTGLFSRNSSNLQLASTGSFLLSYQIPLSNAYLPVAARNQLCTASGITVAQCTAAAAAKSTADPNYREVPVVAGRRFTEFGPRGGPVDFDQFQVQTGVRGSIFGKLKYDLSGQYGETNVNSSRENWGSYSRLQQALRSYTTTAGAPACFDISNGCVPFNLFGATGTITPAMLNFIDLDARSRTVVTQTVFNGNVSGDLFASPLADKPIAFSIGGEYRSLTARNLPDQPTRTQSEVLGTGAPTPPDFGKYDVKEVFGELIAPLISDKPFLYRVQAEGGIRYSYYSTTKGSITWKAGGDIEPIQGFKFRGMFQHAVRSPNIGELYTTQTTGLGNAADPCSGAAPVGNATLTALCISTGAPASSIGSIPTPSAGQINVTSGGNPNLGVETANTYTLGGVIAPPMLRGVSLTVDYFHIKIKNTIQSIGTQDVLTGCYTAGNPTFCALIKRNPLNGSLNGGGETPGVLAASGNLGNTETAGIDVGLNDKVSLEDFGLKNAGSFTVGLSGTWLDYYRSQSTPIGVNRECQGYYSTACTNPRPRWKSVSRFTYSLGGFDTSVLWTHLAPVKLEPYLATPIQPLTTPQPQGPNPTTIYAPFQHIPAYDYFDLSFNSKVGENLTFTFTVENLADKQPPNVGGTVGGTAFNNGNTFPTTYDVIGRTYTVGASLRF